MLDPPPLSGRLDQDAPHRLGRRGEEVAAAVKLLIADESQVRLVDEGGGVEGVARRLGRHPRRGQPAESVIHEW